MASGEFSLIETFFNRPTGRSDIILGIGDDCALVAPPALQNLALSIDTLVAGVHFFADTNPEYLGHKALAVNLSDLAAMGARPGNSADGCCEVTPSAFSLPAFTWPMAVPPGVKVDRKSVV